MDGISRAKRQEEIGVRALVEDIDSIRILCGFENVSCSTPRAETMLRSGGLARIPLKFQCILKEERLVIEMTFEVGYPDEKAAEVFVSKEHDDPSSPSPIDETLSLLNEKLNAFCGIQKAAEDDQHQSGHIFAFNDGDFHAYPRAAEIIRRCKIMYAEDYKSALAVADEVPGNQAGGIVVEDSSIVSNDTAISAPREEEVEALSSIINEATSSSSRGIGEHKAPLVTKADIYATCMMCGMFLFDGDTLDIHEAAEPSSQDHRAPAAGQDTAPPTAPALAAIASARINIIPMRCTSLFLTEQPGFLDLSRLSETTGRIVCPNKRCEAKIGQWSWSGQPCTCGVWVAPAFHFPLSRVDLKLKAIVTK